MGYCKDTEVEKAAAWRALCAHRNNIDSLASSVGYGLRGAAGIELPAAINVAAKIQGSFVLVLAF